MLKDWHVYLLRCADGSFYCGASNDPVRRFGVHSRGKGARYTRARLPVGLVTVSPPMSKCQALRLEHGVKRLRKDKKTEAVFHGRLDNGKPQNTGE
jgi:putative endonuclease